MKVKVLSYLPHPLDCHECKELEGDQRTVRIDLLVTNDLPENTWPKDLIGKIVEYDQHPNTCIAYGVSIIE